MINVLLSISAKKDFETIINQYSHIINREIKTIRIRQIKTRWGSCNPSKGYINLNSELIKKPKYCIEYVIFHELAHLVHPNHSRSFYNYLNTYIRLGKINWNILISYKANIGYSLQQLVQLKLMCNILAINIKNNI